MTGTRDSGGREVMGWLEGGYQTLIDALERRIVELGGEAPHRQAEVADRLGQRRRRRSAAAQEPHSVAGQDARVADGEVDVARRACVTVELRPRRAPTG
jgi:phytoene dehydrogenase-like protein